jgi:light-regulated signal transduction histidine kinase (bacteriophytochrome)
MTAINTSVYGEFDTAPVGKPRKRQGATWALPVADNRIGMPADHAENVFTIFKRLHTRRGYPGNDVGLVICRKIIERHEGRTEALPRGRGGTIVRFSLLATVSAETRESA